MHHLKFRALAILFATLMLTLTINAFGQITCPSAAQIQNVTFDEGPFGNVWAAGEDFFGTINVEWFIAIIGHIPRSNPLSQQELTRILSKVSPPLTAVGIETPVGPGVLNTCTYNVCPGCQKVRIAATTFGAIG